MGVGLSDNELRYRKLPLISPPPSVACIEMDSIFTTF